VKRKTARQLKVYTKRPKDLGLLIVVGGPGGSGSSTIAKMLAAHYGLHRIYGGAFMRQIARRKGYATLEEFISSDEFNLGYYHFDKQIDEETVKAAMHRDVLVESKNFAAIATNEQIPCTVKIWLDADIQTRVWRSLASKHKIKNPEKIDKKSDLYHLTLVGLMQRYSNDKNRYSKLYGIEYEKPELYNDIVIDTTHMNAGETFNKILMEVKRGKFIKSRR
jgi:cytidylate kinase